MGPKNNQQQQAAIAKLEKKIQEYETKFKALEDRIARGPNQDP